jgi:hypothetical protein
MLSRLCLAASLILVVTCLGCRARVSNVDKAQAETKQLKAELAQLQEEIKGLKSAAERSAAAAKSAAAKSTPTTAEKPAKKAGVADELERLDALRSKGILTPEEFAALKQAALNGPPPPTTSSVPSMKDINEQLRVIYGLYQNSKITNVERDQKKQQILDKPLRLENLKEDLELAHNLYQNSIITNVDLDLLKKKLLEAEPAQK